MAKKILYKIEPGDRSITLRDIVKRIEEIQKNNPDDEIFFDGDEFAICSRPRKGAGKDKQPQSGDKKDARGRKK
jgi:hypothetical protein